MHRTTLLGTVAIIATLASTSAPRFHPCRATSTESTFSEGTFTPPATTTTSLSPMDQWRLEPWRPSPHDPWQCYTKQITKYFTSVPTATGAVSDAIVSYIQVMRETCTEWTPLPVAGSFCSDQRLWCGFPTVAPASVLVDYYLSYVPAVTSFELTNSAAISDASSSCPILWEKALPHEHAWMQIAKAHAECYKTAVGDAS